MIETAKSAATGQETPEIPAPKKRTHSGDAPIVRMGHDRLFFRDLYVNLLSMPWLGLLGLIAGFYLAVNLLFAVIYYFNLNGIDQAHSFSDAFFFSVQTMATIGYGHMDPTSLTVNVLTTIEVLVGIIYSAFITGLMFAKFSRPTAHLLFSNVAVISNYEGEPHLKIRLANQRANRIVDVTARLFLLRYSVTKEGYPMRKFIDLPVQRNHMPILRLTWTVMHPIDQNSPFFAMSQADMMQSDDEIFITIMGLDETLSQTIHARHSYLPEEILPGAYFDDVVKRNDDNVEINYGKFHDVHYGTPAGKAPEDVEESKSEGGPAATG